MVKRVRESLPLLALVVVGGLAVAQTIDNRGREFPYVARLEQDGVPVDGRVDLRFSLFGAESGGSPCHVHTALDVEVRGGVLATTIADAPDACLASGAAWLELEVAAAGSGAFVWLTSSTGRQRLGAVPFATAVPESSSFLVGTGEIRLEDPETSAVYTLKGGDDVAPASGVSLRALTNPPAGQPLFRVLSSAGTERLRVEHDGNVEMDNGLAVSGPVSVGGRLSIAEEVVGGGGTAGCQRIGQIHTCWARSVVEAASGNQNVDWLRPFLDTSYAVTCTAVSGPQADRTAVIRSRSTGTAVLTVFQPSGEKSTVNADCVAIGRGGTW